MESRSLLAVTACLDAPPQPDEDKPRFALARGGGHGAASCGLVRGIGGARGSRLRVGSRALVVSGRCCGQAEVGAESVIGGSQLRLVRGKR